MTPLEQSQRDEIHAIDLLVDGELDEARRRELLSRLENTPGGWRRCALAFLEAQSWQEGSRAWITARDGSAAAPISPGGAGPLLSTAARNMLALAASFIAAFALGAWYRSRDAATETNLAGGAPRASSEADAPPALATDREADPERYVTLVLDGVADGESNQVRLPVRDWGQLQQLARQPSALPETLVEQIEQSGHTVRQRRQLVPVDLRDGRQMIVPMDEVQIVPVSRTFQ